ncbi:MAG: Phosphomannomutase [Microgenomates group bacterium GW2011_GWF2_45_18]|nr:MAG: Phosphomannomutase [Microgenomates group bacterium GW2011_GWF1_44_10]KKU02178.1 MAG: Phosphomannomutase [Microgenomates group bacterium GW2011_GWF2_45_18]OGJ40909.1 MAG: hypothetical protein A2378_03160 [Candidatus Pacebacteria bacterium RIFOXYB1_FULL_44_10]HAU99328.1 hypothetical protein [Candidatus Paceibacterota bacterium]HAX01846.1 hypothetical protein [Candidatus Paceibacterota bacterium]
MYQLVPSISPVIFRGYDIRGLVGSELTEDVYYTLGRAYATFLRKRRVREATVGMDNRLSSEVFAKAFRQGLNDGGVDSIFLGLSLSQIVYFSSYECKTKGAAMITASHNPKEFNGLKLGTGYSETMETAEINEYKEIVRNGKFSEGRGTDRTIDIFESYAHHLLKHFSLTKKWKVVIDACSTGSGVFYPQLFEQAGCEVVRQNCEPDGNFPSGVPDPTESEVLERLAARVLAEKADIGFAYDTDGDRMACVDSTGQVLYMDQIIALFVKDVLSTMPNAPIIFNTLCSQVVRETIVSQGGKPIMWVTGHSFIKAKVKEEKAPFGGELSGHIYFTDNFYGHDDGAYASLRLLQYLESKNHSLNQEIAVLPKFISSPEIKLGLADAIKFEVIKTQIAPVFHQKWPTALFTEIDGVRAEENGNMVIIRASQNGPYITIKFESKTQQGYDELKKDIRELLHSIPEIDWSKGVNIHAFE